MCIAGEIETVEYEERKTTLERDDMEIDYDN